MQNYNHQCLAKRISQINNLMLNFKKLEKQEIKTKVSKGEETNKDWSGDKQNFNFSLLFFF